MYEQVLLWSGKCNIKEGLIVVKAVFLDCETTGLKPGQITQLSYLVVEQGKLIKRVNQYLSVDKIEDDAARVTGLTKERLDQLSFGTKFFDRRLEFYSDLYGSIIVAHNAPFDVKFLTHEFRNCNIGFQPYNVVDTMRAFKEIVKIPYSGKRTGYKNPKLEEVLDYFSIKTGEVEGAAKQVFGNFDLQAHDARYDATALVMIAVRCKGYSIDIGLSGIV